MLPELKFTNDRTFYFTKPITRSDFITERQYKEFI